ncbi:alpha/beta hydrolase [Alicyclobacillus ferrooxydans]|uniref:Alpha/beta hydrolase n=1 Tax=Alicyclobacillus ferrooxydans TaxID=471514 RepID=A0A0P9CGS8_9BACL|nr:alpha/beta hydrolase [Alicyclobacillus ferrooxydans]KPV42231.1 hypothetical protein AN477_18075 [Alicyclobacillus ferrooxydans]
MPILKVPTKWGTQHASYPYVTHSSDSSKLAVLFPGRNYPLDAPLLWYAKKAAYAAGCDVLGVEYGYQANRADLVMEDLDTLVSEVVDALATHVSRQYQSVTFIGKSIGTVVLAKVLSKVHFSVRNQVFLTPLRPVIPAIQSAERSLVIVGDRDPAFTASDVNEIRPSANAAIHVIPGADHSLEVEDVGQSLDILKRVALLCTDFCTSET